MQFRDKQIQKLNAKCSMLQIELEKYIETPPKRSKTDEKFKEKTSKIKKTVKIKDTEEVTKEKETKKPEVETMPAEMEKEQDEVVEVDEIATTRVSLSKEKLDELEACAAIIASLNHEVMQLLEVSYV